MIVSHSRYLLSDKWRDPIQRHFSQLAYDRRLYARSCISSYRLTLHWKRTIFETTSLYTFNDECTWHFCLDLSLFSGVALLSIDHPIFAWMTKKCVCFFKKHISLRPNNILLSKTWRKKSCLSYTRIFWSVINIKIAYAGSQQFRTFSFISISNYFQNERRKEKSEKKYEKTFEIVTSTKSLES